MTSDVRVRFPPSPTGEPHVGNIRTAIFNWLFARHHEGSFVIRIEDTDQRRKVEGATEALLESLRWLGIDWDEGPDVGGEFGPYVQSERLDLYHSMVARLVDSGRAYRCFCTSERLADLRKEQSRLKQQVGYDGLCRSLSQTDAAANVRAGQLSVVRFRMPDDGITEVSDAVRGEVTFENGLIDDFVILKSDDFPTYHLANVVDDRKMKISHVLRGEQWLSSTPRHVRLYEALGWEQPIFAHLPDVLAPDRSKLSKRHGATSILEYREMGLLPQTMVNFLSLLGWALDDKTEIFSTQDLTKHFSLRRVAKSGAVFNLEKLNWMNGHYLREVTQDELADALFDHWAEFPPNEIPDLPERDLLLSIGPLIQERLKTLNDAAPLIGFFFQANVEYETGELIQKGMDAAGTKAALDASEATLRDVESFDSDSIEGALRTLADELGVKVGQLLGSLRVATTGLRVAPPLFQAMEILGRDRVLAAAQEASRRL